MPLLFSALVPVSCPSQLHTVGNSQSLVEMVSAAQRFCQSPGQTSFASVMTVMFLQCLQSCMEPK